ncbi:hypothetical protein BOTBODRAFT_187411 [Botryobasidium botryosum FD-172 SS1]|uniref:Prolyl 4-hydroxylase alpha subunit Fe(2+) 2OG dioxygenase domain-containing protein n=1 Tax=Botryobasidium botryosum (strain FD-172 SS1) TaxID=930990 RepID=A0A067MTY6_BOTB1|nr:hypothetical protein BOTBODRAFT_187411 [Botryobasidium botryosum FD-172 SS1]
MFPLVAGIGFEMELQEQSTPTVSKALGYGISSESKGVFSGSEKFAQSGYEAAGESDHEDTEPRIENPSTQICRDLEKIISSATKSLAASYRFESRCYDAPNPALRLTIGSIGTVGLPLGELAAKQIIENSRRAEFHVGEQPNVNMDARGIWEMDAEFVKFGDSRWESFIMDLATRVCAGLGVQFYARKPKVELYKLWLCETGSSALPRRYTEKVDGMFAAMMVMLPSAFTGGATCLSHAGLSKAVDLSVDSLSSSSVVAWYTDVTHELKPITSGYRLALAYNLIHTTNAPRPSLPLAYSSLPELRHIFLSWRQSGYSGPQKVIYLLENTYPEANTSALRGSDAHLASLLDDVATQLGFHLGLARAVLTLSGWGYCEDYDLEYDGEDYADFVEDADRSTMIKGLVDLDGNHITKEVLIDEEDEKERTIPEGLSEALERGGPDHQRRGYVGHPSLYFLFSTYRPLSLKRAARAPV